MKYTLSGRLWNEGCELVKKNKVRKPNRMPMSDGTIFLRASVDSAFGFVHHPMAIYEEDLKTVMAHTCDCWNASAGVFCEHCAALIADATKMEEGNIQIDAYPEENRRLSMRVNTNESLDNQKNSRNYSGLSIKNDHILPSGNREVEGHMICAFGFVHYPVLVLHGSKVADYHCDCYEIAEKPGLCSHCETLMCYIAEQDAKTEEKPEEMTGNDTGVTPETDPDTTEKGTDAVPDTTEKDIDTTPEVVPDTTGKRTDQTHENTKAVPEEDSVTDPAADFSPLHEPCSMKILLGHNPKDNSPVYWYPNDTEQLVHVNTGIIGTMGTGKTQFTKSLITQLFRQQYNNFDGRELSMLIFDYKGDYNLSKEDFVQASQAKVLGLHNLPFNPMSLRGLKAKPQLPYHVASAFANILTKIYHLGPVQNNLLLDSIIRAYAKRGISSDPSSWNRPAPTFEDVYQIYQENTPKQDALYSAMYALHQFEIFEKDPMKTQSLFSMLDGVVVLDLSGYDSRIQNLTVAITLELFCSQMLGSGSSRSDRKYRQLTRLILVDEADNIMSEGFPALKTIMKEGREFGVGTILSTQSLKHFGIGEEDYASYILTWIVHAVPDLKKSDVEYLLKTTSSQSEQFTQEIARLPKHHSISRVGNAEPIYMEDTPFWKISDDVFQTYLKEEDDDNEEDTTADEDEEENDGSI